MANRFAVVLTLPLVVSLGSCKEPETGSGLAEAESGMFPNETVCDQLIREAGNDAKRQGGLNPYPVFEAKKQAQVERLTAEHAQCLEKEKATQSASASGSTTASTEQGQADTQVAAGEGQQTQQFDGFALTESPCPALQTKLDETKACIMPGSNEAIGDAALKCALGEVKKAMGGMKFFKNDYYQIISSCTSVGATTAEGPSVKIDTPNCVAKLAQAMPGVEGMEVATEIGGVLSIMKRAITCGQVGVQLTVGALEVWTANINTHWRPGETNLDGLPVKRTEQLDGWRRNECSFGGKIPAREWFTGHSGQASCTRGCTDFVNGSDLYFFNSKQYYKDLREPCRSKCEFICGACCNSNGCQIPALGGRNSYGTPSCDWESKAQ